MAGEHAAGEGRICTDCPYKRRANWMRISTLVFGLLMWGADNVIAWVTRFLPDVPDYNSSWWMYLTVLGLLAASHLWEAPKIKALNGGSKA